MKYDQKFEELLIVFIITSITYFGIKIFFQFMKVTKVKKKEERFANVLGRYTLKTPKGSNSEHVRNFQA